MLKRRARALSLFTFGLAVVLASLWWDARQHQPHVLIILADTLRADRLGMYGCTQARTPFLDQLGARGVVFANAYAPSAWTTPSIASIFTATYPSEHRVVYYGAKIAPAHTTMAERLQSLGYRSGGFSGNFLIDRSLGFARGFDHWETVLPPRTEGIKTRGEMLRKRALQWLDESPGRHAAPTFLYVHYMEPHGPYQPPDAFRRPPGVGEGAKRNQTSTANDPDRTRSPSAARALMLYDGEVAALDAEVEQLFHDLERRGFLDGAIVVFTSDHGEEFQEHGGFGHGRALFDESIHVPLILIAPGLPAGRVVDDTVSLIDLAPTLLELLQAPASHWAAGRSLTSLMHGRDGTQYPRDVISELPKVQGSEEKREHVGALIHGHTKLIFTLDGDIESYDLSRDANERRPVPGPFAPDLAALETTLRDVVARFPESTGALTQRRPIDAETAERLRTLGYGP